MSRPPKWSIADVLDFEQLLAEDAGAEPAALAARDRRIFAEKIAPDLGSGGTPERPRVFHAWLAARRGEAGTVLAGESFESGWRLLLVAALIAGLLVGFSVAAGALRYPGREPVNIWVFLGLVLAPQYLIPALALLACVILKRRPGGLLLNRLMGGLAARLQHLPGEQRQRLRVAMARIAEKRELFGSLALWPSLICTQVFAVAFNIGVLGSLATDVTTRELRFGWQTTLELPEGRFEKIVRGFSAPWSWAPAARPADEQIAATRYAPGQDHSTLPGNAMRAWWPFLAYAVTFYGLLVRCAVLAWAVLGLRRVLAKLDLQHAAANALWRRLQPPVIVPGPSMPMEHPDAAATPAPHRPAPGAALALMDEELEIRDEEAAAGLRRLFGWELCAGGIRLPIDRVKTSPAALEALRGKAPVLAGAAVLIPAARDPIVAVRSGLQLLLEAAGGRPELIIVLLGRRDGDGFAPVPAERLKIWRDFRTIHQLKLGVEAWPGL